MGGPGMKIGVLTSSRADYGIYRPLLLKLKEDAFFDLEIIAFGTHVSNQHGMTISEIEKDGFQRIHTISSLISDDNAGGIVTSYGLTIIKFADFWKDNNYDIIFCLGDRFEMSAAVQAGIPFNVNFAHIHGGETTLGAIDNIYRHQITLASALHFTSTEAYKDKVEALREGAIAYNVGSLSIDEINTLEFSERKDFLKRFDIPDTDFALITFHPETIVSVVENERMAIAMQTALMEISDKLHLVITMPNADTFGSVFRNKIVELKGKLDTRLTIIENFGKLNYFNAMKHSSIMIGNTSSGIIEAASFGKYVINVGNRQKGRIAGVNVINCPFEAARIVELSLEALEYKEYDGANIYFKSGAADIIISILKKKYGQFYQASY